MEHRSTLRKQIAGGVHVGNVSGWRKGLGLQLNLRVGVLRLKNMKVPNQLFALAFISMVVLCVSESGSAQKVRYNYLPGTDFSKYKTYRWVRIQNVEYPSEILDERIKRSIDVQLSAKGFSRIENGTPDLLAIYQAAVNHE